MCFCVVCPFYAMITYSVGVNVVAVSETPLEDDKPSFRVVKVYVGVVVSEWFILKTIIDF